MRQSRNARNEQTSAGTSDEVFEVEVQMSPQPTPEIMDKSASSQFARGQMTQRKMEKEMMTNGGRRSYNRKVEERSSFKKMNCGLGMDQDSKGNPRPLTRSLEANRNQAVNGHDQSAKILQGVSGNDGRVVKNRGGGRANSRPSREADNHRFRRTREHGQSTRIRASSAAAAAEVEESKLTTAAGQTKNNLKQPTICVWPPSPPPPPAAHRASKLVDISEAEEASSPRVRNMGHLVAWYCSVGRSDVAAERCRKLLAEVERAPPSPRLAAAAAEQSAAGGQAAAADPGALTQSRGLEVASVLALLSRVKQLEERDGEAVQLLCRALDIKTKILGAVHPTVAVTLNQITVIYGRRGRYSEAECFCRRALELRCRATVANVPAPGTRERADWLRISQRMAEQLTNMGVIEENLGRYEAAKALYRRAANTYSAIKLHLASVYVKAGDALKAELLYKAAADAKTRSLRVMTAASRAAAAGCNRSGRPACRRKSGGGGVLPKNSARSSSLRRFVCGKTCRTEVRSSSSSSSVSSFEWSSAARGGAAAGDDRRHRKWSGGCRTTLPADDDHDCVRGLADEKTRDNAASAAAASGGRMW